MCHSFLQSKQEKQGVIACDGRQSGQRVPAQVQPTGSFVTQFVNAKDERTGWAASERCNGAASGSLAKPERLDVVLLQELAESAPFLAGKVRRLGDVPLCTQQEALQVFSVE